MIYRGKLKDWDANVERATKKKPLKKLEPQLDGEGGRALLATYLVGDVIDL